MTARASRMDDVNRCIVGRCIAEEETESEEAPLVTDSRARLFRTALGFLALEPRAPGC